MSVFNVQEAERHLSRLLDEVQQGREVVIAKGDKPVARLVPYIAKRNLRVPGYLKGRIEIAEDFDSPLPDDVIASFEGRH